MGTEVQRFEFEGEAIDLPVIEYDGEHVIPAHMVAAALGYATPSDLSTAVRGKWKHEFRSDKDFVVLKGAELKAAKAVFGDLPISGTRTLVLLTLSGAQIAGMLSRTDRGRAFRFWIADTVLPSYTSSTITVGPELMARVEQTEAGLATIGAAVARLADAVHVLATRQTPAQQGNLPERMVLPPPEGWLRAGQIASDNKIKISRVNAVIKALRKEYGRIGCVGPRTGWHAGETYFYSPIEIERIEAGLLARGWIEDPKNNIINMFRVK